LDKISFIFAVISPFFTLILILGYFCIKQLRQQPGDFFFGFAIGEIAVFVIAVVETIENNKPENFYGMYIPESFCFGISFTRVFFRRAIRLYHICFIIYYLQSLRSSLKSSRVSTTLYHAIPWLGALGLVLYEWHENALGKTMIGTCDIRTSAAKGQYTVDLILCALCLVASGILIVRFSSRYRGQGAQVKRQIQYYLSYFVFANLFLMVTFAFNIYTSISISNTIGSNNPQQIQRIVQNISLVEHYSIIYIDICSSIILTIIRLFDPSMGRYWKELVRKIFCCCYRSRTNSQSISTGMDLEIDGDKPSSMSISLKASDLQAIMEKSSFIDQVNYHSRLQVVYSLLAAIHYSWKQDPRRKSTATLGISDPKDDIYYNRKAKVQNKHQITEQMIEENLPDIMNEIRSKKKAILPGKLTVHAPEVFEEIMKLDEMETSLIDSLDLRKNYSNIIMSGQTDGGRSGEFFFFSNDNRLIIKTISTKEMNVLLGILPRFLGHFQRNPNSIIAKIYAAFTFEVEDPSEKYHLILMKNINGYPGICTERKYDLKGATVDRSVLDRNIDLTKSNLKNFGTMKDLDFDKYESKLNLSEESQNALLDTIVRDIAFLRMEFLIDYSLAVYLVNKNKINLSTKKSGSGTSLDATVATPETSPTLKKGSLNIEDNEDIKSPLLRSRNQEQIAHPLLSIKSTKEDLYYHVGIIDYLTKYDWKKKCEKFYKQMKALNFNLDTSCQDPHTYNRRFLGYMERIILEDYVNQNGSILL